MWDAPKIQQSQTSLFFYHSGKSLVPGKHRRVSNLKEIFKHKSKSLKNPKTKLHDTEIFNSSVNDKSKKAIDTNTLDKNRLSKDNKFTGKGQQRKTITNFTIFKPRLPTIISRETQSIHMRSLQMDEQEQGSDQNNTQESMEMKVTNRVKKNVQLLLGYKKGLKSVETQNSKKDIFNFCNLEFDVNKSSDVNKKKSKQKQVIRVRKKKAENDVESHKNHQKRISMFEIEGAKAFGINQYFPFRQNWKKKYNIETIYLSDMEKKAKKIKQSIKIKERQGSQLLGGWDNKSDSSAQYF